MSLDWLAKPQYLIAIGAPLAAYLLWRLGARHLRAAPPNVRYLATWAVVVLPLLAWFVPYVPDAPLKVLPYQVPLVWGAYRDADPSAPELVRRLATLPLLAFAVGAPVSLVWGVAEYLVARCRIGRLPGRRIGDVTVLRVPGFVAFTFGLLRPRAYVSEQVWNSPHRYAVLAHERAHIKRRDPLTLWVARGVRRGTVWYLPFWSRLLRQLELDAELACDAEASGTVGRATYARALLAAVDDRLSGPPSLAPVALAFSQPATDDRMIVRARTLADPPSASERRLAFLAVWGLACLTIVLLL